MSYDLWGLRTEGDETLTRCPLMCLVSCHLCLVSYETPDSESRLELLVSPHELSVVDNGLSLRFMDLLFTIIHTGNQHTGESLVLFTMMNLNSVDPWVTPHSSPFAVVSGDGLITDN